MKQIKINDDRKTVFTESKGRFIKIYESDSGHYIYFEYKSFKGMKIASDKMIKKYGIRQ